MGDLEVDITGLENLVHALSGVREGMEDTRSTISRHESALGSDDVVTSLDRFEDRWDDGRGQVRENIDALVGAIQDSAEAYRTTDDDLATALADAVSETGA